MEPARIGVFAFARTQSERCPNKMLRPFAGTTLTDIVLEKLSAFQELINGLDTLDDLGKPKSS